MLNRHPFAARFLSLLLVVVAAVPHAQGEEAVLVQEARKLYRPLYPSSRKPDNIVLARSASPDRMTVTWRTSQEVADGSVQYRRMASGTTPASESSAVMLPLVADELASDTTVHCFSAAIENLEPRTRYQYRVGSPGLDAWSEWREFKSGADKGDDFAFVYLGDTQVDFEGVGEMIANIEERRPDVGMYLIGGDLVTHGELRNEWDTFLHHTTPVFSRKPMMPAMGNHDDEGDPSIVSRYLTLPPNGQDAKGKCKNYYFTHGDAFFVVLDSNYSKSKQAAWLRRALKKADDEGYAFKIAMFHKPVFHPREGRSGLSTQKAWLPLLDRYNVDLVLTGHDHSYLRTKKLRAGNVVDDDDLGTVYVVATSCDKFYKYQTLDYAATQFTDVATYQIIDIEMSAPAGPMLHYKAYDRDGKLMDSFSLASAANKRSAVQAADAPVAAAPASPVENGAKIHGPLRVEGTSLVDQHGEPIQLRGLSSHGIHWYPQFVNTGALLDIKKRGANLFRVAMYADSNNDGYNSDSRNRRLNKRLLRLGVENSLAADLYTIIDWHLLEDQNPLKTVDRAVEFFDEMSRIYAGNPAVIYEICNEPNGPATWDDIYTYAEKIIPVIRKNAPDAVILVGTPKYSSDVLSVLDKPLGFDNIMYSYHMYTGYTDYDFIKILDTARAKGLPVFVSEWGISKEKGQDEHDVEEGYDFLDYMNEHRLSWAYWALCNAGREYVVIKENVDKLNGWTEDDLTVPGAIIFSALENGVPKIPAGQ